MNFEFYDYTEEELNILLEETLKRYNFLCKFNYNNETTKLLEKRLENIKKALEIKIRERFLLTNSNQNLINFNKNKSIVIPLPERGTKASYENNENNENIFKKGIVIETDPYLAKLNELQEKRDDLIDLE